MNGKKAKRLRTAENRKPGRKNGGNVGQGMFTRRNNTMVVPRIAAEMHEAMQRQMKGGGD